MNFLKFVYGHRGAVNFARRSFQILSRFGPGPGRMGKRFDRFMNLLGEYDCRPTFPITALPLSRHPGFARDLLDRGAELAVHAYTHIDLTTLDYRSQAEHIEKAVHTFRALGVPYSGFRAPYLRWNEDTMKVVEAYKFRYSSNRAVLWDVMDLKNLEPSGREGWEKGMAFYHPVSADQMAVLPYFHRGFVEIPISLPDDEVLFDRMYVHDPDLLFSVWERIFEMTYERGELFTIQLHPERIYSFMKPLDKLLSICRSRKPGVWISTLEGIARWWRDKEQNEASFVREGDQVRVKVQACQGATILLRIEGKEKKMEPGEFIVNTKKIPCISVGPGSNANALRQLQDRGYVVEVGEWPGDFALHLGELRSSDYQSISGVLRKLREFPGPLVHFGTWPHDNRSALVITGDIDALTIWDFVNRMRGA